MSFLDLISMSTKISTLFNVLDRGILYFKTKRGILTFLLKKNSTINQVVKISLDIFLTLLNETIYIESKMLTCKLTCMELKDIERLTTL